MDHFDRRQDQEDGERRVAPADAAHLVTARASGIPVTGSRLALMSSTIPDGISRSADFAAASQGRDQGHPPPVLPLWTTDAPGGARPASGGTPVDSRATDTPDSRGRERQDESQTRERGPFRLRFGRSGQSQGYPFRGERASSDSFAGSNPEPGQHKSSNPGSLSTVERQNHSIFTFALSQTSPRRTGADLKTPHDSLSHIQKPAAASTSGQAPGPRGVSTAPSGSAIVAGIASLAGHITTAGKRTLRPPPGLGDSNELSAPRDAHGQQYSALQAHPQTTSPVEQQRRHTPPIGLVRPSALEHGCSRDDAWGPASSAGSVPALRSQDHLRGHDHVSPGHHSHIYGAGHGSPPPGQASQPHCYAGDVSRSSHHPPAPQLPSSSPGGSHAPSHAHSHSHRSAAQQLHVNVSHDHGSNGPANVNVSHDHGPCSHAHGHASQGGSFAFYDAEAARLKRELELVEEARSRAHEWDQHQHLSNLSSNC